MALCGCELWVEAAQRMPSPEYEALVILWGHIYAPDPGGIS